jgi:hypothetical protein
MTLILSGTNGLSDVDGDASTPAVRGTDANTGIFFPAADTIAFAEGGAEAMRIDSSGNLLVGTTTTPSSSGIVGVLARGDSSYIQFTKTNATAGGYAVGTDGSNFLIYNHTGTVGSESYTERMRIDSSGNVGIGTTAMNYKLNLRAEGTVGDTSVYMQFTTTDTGTANTDGGVIGLGVGSSPIMYVTNYENAALAFSTNNTERMRITSGGDLLVGTTTGVGSGRQELIVGGNAGGTYIGLGRSGTNAANIQLDSGDNLSIQNTASQPINVVATTNGVTLANGGTSWGAFSDERKKDIIEPITNAAEKVSSLRAVIGKYKTEEDGIRRSMLIAQDVQAVLPEAVVENNDGDLILHYTDTIPLLVAAIKELKAELDTVKAELATLKGN